MTLEDIFKNVHKNAYMYIASHIIHTPYRKAHNNKLVMRYSII